ncbi:MAG: GNAT family N-acetyltransferase [Bacteroidetes bacterium]|jgi:ribosomal-protein-alanine N-acetyltransferase|nr:GNAT family N-acetyltransferase [Bacteroidota bacterium]MDF1865601.1 GNAT family N-acetyltransferase [Saprospiraceae bacterium]
MLVHLETPRLFLHNFLPEDAQGIFALDTDPKVMKYLGGVKMTQFFKAEKTIEYIQKQYKEHGIGRLAIIEKSTDKFVGWSGLKLEKGNLNGQMQSYDLGYRLLQQFLGKGYATESATASLKYGFEDLNLTEIIGIADINNKASNQILQKIGMTQYKELEFYNRLHSIYKIEKQNWSD